jgi:hypothetical protein
VVPTSDESPGSRVREASPGPAASHDAEIVVNAPSIPSVQLEECVGGEIRVPSVSDDLETEVAQFIRVRTAEVMLADHRSARSIGMRALHDHSNHGFGLTGVLQLTALLHLTNLTAPSAMRGKMQLTPTRGRADLHSASSQTRDVTAALAAARSSDGRGPWTI